MFHCTLEKQKHLTRLQNVHLNLLYPPTPPNSGATFTGNGTTQGHPWQWARVVYPCSCQPRGVLSLHSEDSWAFANQSPTIIHFTSTWTASESILFTARAEMKKWSCEDIKETNSSTLKDLCMNHGEFREVLYCFFWWGIRSITPHVHMIISLVS